MTKLEEIALAIFRKVTGDPEASWETMSAEERGDALEWARAGLEAAREPSAEAIAAGRALLREAFGGETEGGNRFVDFEEVAGRMVRGQVDAVL